ncbi:MAG: sec-independent translocase [Actinomycetales bacterium]
MFFGMGGGEVIVVALVALIVLGPEKLPHYAGEAARWLRDLRRVVANARREVTSTLGPEFQDIRLSDLDPRSFVTRTIFDGDDDPLGLREDGEARVRRDGPRLQPGELPPVDLEAT